MTTEKMNKSAIYSWLIIALLGIYINLEQSFLTILSEWWFWLSLCGILNCHCIKSMPFPIFITSTILIL